MKTGEATKRFQGTSIRIVLSSTCLLLAAVCIVAAFNEPRTDVFVEPDSIVLDFVDDTRVLDARTTLYNHSDEDIVVLRAITSCGCALIDNLEGNTVAAGDSLSIAMKWDISSKLKSSEVNIVVVFAKLISPDIEEGTLVFKCTSRPL